MPHNVWTCGDYTKNLNGFTVNPDNQNLFINLDNTFVVNGDNNILIHRLTQQAYYAQAYYKYTLNPEDYGKTFIFTANVKNNLNGVCSIQISGDSLKYSVIPKDSEGVFSITYSNVTSNSINVVVAFAGAITGKVFFDNLVLNVIED